MELRNNVDLHKKKALKRQVDFSDCSLEQMLHDEKVDKTIAELQKLVIAKPNSPKKLAKPKDLTRPRNIHKDHRQRLKNQYIESGFKSLSDIQKLELLLFYSIPQKDTNPIAHELLDEFGSLKDVMNADIPQLVSIKGVKESSAILINLIGKLFNVISMPDDYEKLGKITEAKAFCKKFYAGVEVEQFYVICLTKSNRVKKFKMIQSGTTDEVSVQIRSITQFALDCKCNRIIISHNHPAGEGKMSDEDCKFTYSLLCSCMLNSIEIVDHIIVGVNRVISMDGCGVLEKLKQKAFDRLQLSPEKRTYLSTLSENYVNDDDDTEDFYEPSK